MSTPQDPFGPPSQPVGDAAAQGRAQGGPAPAGGPGWEAAGGYGGGPAAPYGTAPYGAAPYGTAPAGPRPKGMAIAALVLGILALLSSWTVVGGIALGLVALVLGVLAARKAARGLADGRGMGIAGAVLGGLALVISVVVIVAGVAFFNSDTGKKLRDCISQAGNDQAAQQQCQQQFADDVTR